MQCEHKGQELFKSNYIIVKLNTPEGCLYWNAEASMKKRSKATAAWDFCGQKTRMNHKRLRNELTLFDADLHFFLQTW